VSAVSAANIASVTPPCSAARNPTSTSAAATSTEAIAITPISTSVDEPSWRPPLPTNAIVASTTATPIVTAASTSV
jgi:hypothetical protein